MTSTITAAGRGALASKAGAQKATGKGGKFGHLQKGAPNPSGFPPPVAPSLYDTYGIHPNRENIHADALEQMNAIQEVSVGIREAYPDARWLELVQNQDGENQWDIVELRGANSERLAGEDELEELDVDGHNGNVIDGIWKLPAEGAVFAPGVASKVDTRPNDFDRVVIDIRTGSGTPQLGAHYAAGTPEVPRRGTQMNAHGHLHTRAEVEANHAKIMERYAPGSGKEDLGEFYTREYEARIADFDAAQPLPGTIISTREQLEALGGKVKLQSSSETHASDTWEMQGNGYSAECTSAGEYRGPITEITLPATVL